MKIHEYQAKQLFRDAGVPTPRGVLVTEATQARAAYGSLGSEVAVVKAQIHAGGRGKGRFVSPSPSPSMGGAGPRAPHATAPHPSPPPQGGREQVLPGGRAPLGGVKLVRSADEAADVAGQMLGSRLVTVQTGPEGQVVRKVWIEEGCRIARELYLGMVVDRGAGWPVLMVSSEGGVEIEDVAAKTPEKIFREPIDPDAGLQSYQARRLGFKLGLDPAKLRSAEQFMRNLVRLFVAKDCSLAEINPLVVQPDGDLLALDAKINFDDNALFRHPELAALRDLDEEQPAEVRAAAAGLSYVKLDGTIGCLVNGAGLAMSTLDLIMLHGGKPANFLDVGGGAEREAVVEAFRILLDDPNVKAVLVNIFGGIMRCDVIVQALLDAYEEVGFNVPLVVRLEGTNVELARKMLAESGRPIISAAGLTEAAQKVVAAAKGA